MGFFLRGRVHCVGDLNLRWYGKSEIDEPKNCRERKKMVMVVKRESGQRSSVCFSCTGMSRVVLLFYYTNYSITLFVAWQMLIRLNWLHNFCPLYDKYPLT